ncbi:hypothetical protein [Bartonella saheliensis]|uniref:hypothetical protein n=1 Tax=Bartonella saheliensis TaxID=1457016 RepID=UPI0011A9E32A|nr:hypothetical protein [Bartonella saheliensis]
MGAVFIPRSVMKYSIWGDKPLSSLWGWRYSGVVFENSNISFHGRDVREGTLKESPSQEEYIEAGASAIFGEIQFKKTSFSVPNDRACLYRWSFPL